MSVEENEKYASPELSAWYAVRTFLVSSLMARASGSAPMPSEIEVEMVEAAIREFAERDALELERSRGEDAREDGADPLANPHPYNSDPYKAWERGWCAADLRARAAERDAAVSAFRHLAATIDRDGGQRQTNESITQTLLRVENSLLLVLQAESSTAPWPCVACRDEPEAAGPGCSCAHAPCIHDRNATIAKLREELSEQVLRDHAMMSDMRDDWTGALAERDATIRDLREQIAALRSVPTDAPGEAVCADPDCPYPEHVTDCPPPVEAQWEHLAKLRARRIEVMHRWLHERDQVIAEQNRAIAAMRKG